MKCKHVLKIIVGTQYLYCDICVYHMVQIVYELAPIDCHITWQFHYLLRREETKQHYRAEMIGW